MADYSQSDNDAVDSHADAVHAVDAAYRADLGVPADHNSVLRGGYSGRQQFRWDVTMPPLVWKLAPWAIAILAVFGAVKMYGDRRAAEGSMRAHIETADRLQARLTADSLKWAVEGQKRADSLSTLTKQIAAAGVAQKLAARRADSVATDLRATLTETQQAQLDVVTKAHDRERELFAQREAAWAAKLRLTEADRDQARRESADLRQINASLRAATVGCQPSAKPSFVQKVSPYVLGALIAAKGVDFIAHR